MNENLNEDITLENESNEYTIYLLHFKLRTPGTKSSANPFCVKAASRGFRTKPRSVAAAAFIPGVLQNISTKRPKKKLHTSNSFLVVWRGSLMMKMI